MTKIVYNNCFGGFGLSKAAINRYWELKGQPEPEGWWESELRRDDPLLVQVVEELGAEASDWAGELSIRELETGTKYRIDEYDGLETVMTIDEYKWEIA
jgi:hypothetical protein